MTENSKTETWGWSYIESRYYEKLENLPPQSKKTYAVLAIVVSLALLAAGAVISFLPNFVISLMGVPAALVFFLAIITFRRNRNIKTGKTPLREKYSFRSRRQYSIIFGVVSLIVIVYLGTLVPYVVGGALLTTTALLFYDFLRRTPEEIVLDEMGLPDPRDLTEEEYQDYITSFEEAEAEESDTPDAEDSYEEYEEPDEVDVDEADNYSEEEWKDA